VEEIIGEAEESKVDLIVLGSHGKGGLVIGVFIGSGLWFLFLSSGAIFFRKQLDIVGLRWVNRIAGALRNSGSRSMLIFRFPHDLKIRTRRDQGA